MDRPVCETCVYFVAGVADAPGECREGSPKADIAKFTSQYSLPELRTLWPPVRPDDFCGRHHLMGDYLASLRRAAPAERIAEPAKASSPPPAEPTRPAGPAAQQSQSRAAEPAGKAAK